jgi:hypothetical protein
MNIFMYAPWWCKYVSAIATGIIMLGVGPYLCKRAKWKVDTRTKVMVMMGTVVLLGIFVIGTAVMERYYIEYRQRTAPKIEVLENQFTLAREYRQMKERCEKTDHQDDSACAMTDWLRGELQQLQLQYPGRLPIVKLD